MDTESIISRLSKNWNQNSRVDTQQMLTVLFNHPEGWKTRAIPGLSVKRFERFTDFAIHRTPWGLGWTKNVLEAFIMPELSDLWKQIEGEIPKANPNGVKNKEPIIYNSLDNQGTSRDYSIAVLKRDAPEIADQVIQGEISAAEGMRRAGKRKPMVTHPSTVDGFYNAIQKRLTQAEIQELIELL